MDTKKIGTGTIVALVVAALLAIVAMSWISISNKEIRLRNQLNAQQKNMAVVFDNTWKIIEQQAGVATEYRDSFKDIYPQLMQGRYGNSRGGALMSWIQESNPNFDTKLFEKLSDSIEAQRTVFTREQQKAIDLKREHDNLRTAFPSSLVVGGRPEFELKLVTSAKTDAAFKTGQENDVSLFGNKKEPR
jgi:hypothetical protein